MTEVEFAGDHIRLDQFLKLSGAAHGGGEAKMRVQAGEAKVNGEVETRRGRKLRDGDRVELDGKAYLLVNR